MTRTTKLRPTRAFARINAVSGDLQLATATYFAITDSKWVKPAYSFETMAEVYVIDAADYRALVRAAKGNAGRKGRKGK